MSPQPGAVEALQNPPSPPATPPEGAELPQSSPLQEAGESAPRRPALRALPGGRTHGGRRHGTGQKLQAPSLRVAGTAPEPAAAPQQPAALRGQAVPLDPSAECFELPADTTSKSVEALTKLAIVAVGVLLLWATWGELSLGRFNVLARIDSALSWAIVPGIVAALLVAASYVYRTALWFRYKAIDGATVSDQDLPTVTVVIPAFNEGPMVKKSIQSALRSDYPAHKLHVICVDDGSTDDTFRFIEEAASLEPGRVTALKLPQNRGKRHALYEGFRRATSEVLVTLDSDSVMPRASLRNIAAPFATNPHTGAVAGCIKVFNRYRNVLTRMLGVRYLLGFEFTRAYQSVLKSVLCCPGAFAAYRKSVVEPHLDAWLNQHFMGNRCTNGDDHSLTNYVLRSHRDVLYQSNAEVFTVVPHTYKRLAKMYTRWARSNIRESYIWATFATGRARARKEWLAWLDGIIHGIQIPGRLYMLFFTGFVVWTSADLLLQTLAMATWFSILYAFYFLRSEKSTETVYGVLYAWFTLLTLQWIYPWAALTVRRNRWMTRG